MVTFGQYCIVTSAIGLFWFYFIGDKIPYTTLVSNALSTYRLIQLLNKKPINAPKAAVNGNRASCDGKWREVALPILLRSGIP
jgi:hypothetical protein